jgi:ribosomal protein L37AE/L43A
VTGHCAGCGAKLRRGKPSWASCDPCQDRADRRAYDKEQAARRLAEATSKPCKQCGARPVVKKSGSYAWLCFSCRETAREEAARAAS